MAISYVGSNTASAASVTLPAHQNGDLILIFAARENVTPPSTASGYTSITTNGSGTYDTISYRVGYKVAASSSETSGTWTNASMVICHVYRGTAVPDPIGAFNGDGSSSASSPTTITYGALTMQVTDNTSWVAAFSCKSNTTSTLDPPTGMTSRASHTNGSFMEGASFDTNGTLSSWALHTVDVATSGIDWGSVTVELLKGSGTYVTVPVTGVGATGSIGTVLVSQPVNVSPTGVSAANELGTVIAAIPSVVSVTGEPATSALGTVATTGGANTTPTNVSATGAAGAISVLSGLNVEATGVSAIASLGVPLVLSGIIAPVTGVSSSGSVGAVATTSPVLFTVAGVVGVSSLGTAVAVLPESVTVTGVQATMGMGATQVVIGWLVIDTTQTPNWTEVQT